MFGCGFYVWLFICHLFDCLIIDSYENHAVDDFWIVDLKLEALCVIFHVF